MNKLRLSFKTMSAIVSLIYSLSFGSLVATDSGIPALSDVILSTRWVHPANPTDPTNSLKAVTDFHVTRDVWTYLTPVRDAQISFMQSMDDLGVPVEGALNTVATPPPATLPPDPHVLGTKLDINLKPFIEVGVYRGCPSSPFYSADMTNRIQKLLTLSVDAVQFDDPDFWNLFLPQAGGVQYNIDKCYCNYCGSNFRTYLRGKTYQQLASVGISDPTTFDYRTYVLNSGRDPALLQNTLEWWYNDSALQNVIRFWEATRTTLQSVGGRAIPMSGNGVEFASGTSFDFAVSELAPRDADPQHIYDSIQKALNTFGRRLVYTLIDDDVTLTRRTIANAVASGGNHVVPWDVFQGANAPRYYGAPSDYADLFGFMRANATYLDGYTAYEAGGWHLKPTTQTPLLTLVNSSTVTYYVRAYQGELLSRAAVVHFVDSAATPGSFVVKFTIPGGKNPNNLRYVYSAPVPYDQAAHALAQQTGNFSPLASEVVLHPVIQGQTVILTIPAAAPWGMLAIF